MLNNQSFSDHYLLVHPDDDVFVVLHETEQGVPAGHKIARHAISAGEQVRKYGDPIGLATQNIAAGEWVHSHNLKTALSETQTFSYHPVEKAAALATADASPASFDGFVRSDGTVGIRNEIWIIPTVGCVNRTAEKLAAYGRQLLENPQPGQANACSVEHVAAWTHAYGCSQLGEDHEMTRQILLDLARHPNAGGVLILGLGCENNQISTFKELLGEHDAKRVFFLETQAVDDEITVGRKLVEKLISQAAEDRRTSCPLSKLVIGLKCGGSDAFSGLTANPLLGRFSDWLVQAGGSAILSEIPEMFGAEHILLNRSAGECIFRKLADLLQDFRDYYTHYGQPVYENPSPGNKAGGITTLEEKSLGCTQKAGQSPVVDVLKYAQQVRKTGLSVLEGPGNDMVACTALAAAGAQIILFTTGRGNPLGGPVPTVKVASNHELASHKQHWIDFDASPALAGESAWPGLDQQFIRQILAIASGTIATRNETADYREIALFKKGVIL